MTALLDPPARAATVPPAAGPAPGPRLRVLDARPGASVQDPGRPGLAHLGVTASGPVDRAAFATANRLVGNRPGEAAVEVTLGGLAVVLDVPRWVAVTGAPVPVTLDGRPVADPRCVRVPAGARLRLGTPPRGLRSYLAVGGGVRPAPVLGSRARDSLTGLGPPAVAPGVDLPLGPVPGEPPAVPVELAAPRLPGPATRVRFHWAPATASSAPPTAPCSGAPRGASPGTATGSASGSPAPPSPSATGRCPARACRSAPSRSRHRASPSCSSPITP